MTLRRDRLHLVLLGAIVVGGALVRARWLGEPMRYDEGVSFVHYAMSSLGSITSTYDRPNNQILYTVLTHVSWQAFGSHLWTVRLAAYLPGVAIVPVAYLVARRLYDAHAALWAAALTAGFAPLIDYSVNGRGYALGTLLVLVALWLGTLLVERPRTWAWAGFVICSALAIYTVPTMAAGVVLVALWMAGTVLLGRRPLDLRLLVGLALALAATAGLSLLLYSAVLGQPGWTAVHSLPRSWGSIRHLASAVWSNWNRADPHPLDWLVAAGFLISIVLHRRIARDPLPLAAAALVTLAGVAAFGPIARFERSWLFLLPLYLIQAGAGLSWAARRIAAAVLGEERRPDLAAGAIAACAAVALGAATLHAGLRGSDAPPITDNDMVALLRRLVPAGHRALMEPHLGAPASYYFHRFGGRDLVSGSIKSSDRRAGHVVVVVPRAISPLPVVRAASGAPSGSPRVLVRRTWIDFDDVPIRATGRR